MSKMMLLGMSLADVVARSTVNPAKTIGRYPELGNLAVGRTADIAVLEQQTGVFAFKDSWPAKRLGTKRLDCVLTIRDGKLVFERGPVPAGETSTVIYDLLLKRVRMGGGKEPLDIGIAGNRVANVRPGLKAAQAKVVAEAEGYDVAPANVAEGSTADLTLLKAGRTVLTIRNGKVITDDDGLTIPDVSRAGPYSNFK
jgi:predicted amidohydrolase